MYSLFTMDMNRNLKDFLKSVSLFPFRSYNFVIFNITHIHTLFLSYIMTFLFVLPIDVIVNYKISKKQSVIMNYCETMKYRILISACSCLLVIQLQN